MSSKHKKLGSLADIYQSQNLDGTITRIRIDRIHPSQEQPRQDRTAGVEELAASIQTDGLLSPIVVTRDGDSYRIIAGERRYHAMKSLGWTEAECRIISREQRDYYRIALIENLQRENLTAGEEARALLHLKNQEDYSDQELASLVGKSRNYVTEILGIASLPEEVLEECRAAGIESKNFMIQVVQAYRKGTWQDFVEQIKQGNIRTVRAARDFFKSDEKDAEAANNKESESNPRPHTTGESPGDTREEKGSAKAGVQIAQSGSALTIECNSNQAAKKLKTWLMKNLPENFH